MFERSSCLESTSPTCEDETVTLKCQRGEMIKVVGAFYGTSSTQVVDRGDVARTDSCSSARAALATRQEGDERRECAFHVTKAALGGGTRAEAWASTSKQAGLAGQLVCVLLAFSFARSLFAVH